ncbi:TetR/AcrR family transcriptional regulator [Streptomyces marincola]|uniref:TetR/AcrR family transcriptional regulator n=1 Tax=Streptomyces marincola TaxID=2878388 RepID=UPI001C3FEE8C|nr:TetR/AcrR family transcriptional regulator [Streptomyces marincola]
MTVPHRPRADAARNRAGILRAARELLAVRGETVGVDEVARHAGVAVGTLYRHFPTKADLVGTVVDELAERVSAALDEAVARAESGGGAFVEVAVLAERIAEAAGTNRAIGAAVRALAVHGTHRAARLVAAGHAEGTVHRDVTAADLMLLLTTLPGDELPEPARRRWVQLTLRALAAGPSPAEAG